MGMVILKILLVFFLFIPIAHAASERTIWIGCLNRAESVFYIAQEKLYATGNATQLLEFIKKNTTPAEYEVTKKQWKILGDWVDEKDYPTAKKYARNYAYTCVDNTYKYFHRKPTDEVKAYTLRFEKLLEQIQEIPDNLKSF